MARDYGKSRSIKRRSNGARHILSLLVSFLCGYLTATIFDFTSLSAWVNKHVLSNKQTPSQVVMTKPIAPKPKFEFYTLLSKDDSAPIVNHRGPPSETAGLKPALLPAELQVPKTNTNQTSPAFPPVQQATAVVDNKLLPMAAIKPALNKNIYLIQVAAFSKKQDAEHLKASLLLKGFDVHVAMVAQQKTNWYRVVIGPFHTRADAERAQIVLNRNEHIKGMIRKLDS